ncbi:hypothetical protein TRAPUB_2373 [Trametes pubescens]|uniref:Uncharacterized protein n=1 Tax=Trametes pubescens TaxID=154538 RepID=A0A1M2VGX4_TRAPU|nr:hypothetical protein TRAPUB_2373 [Trametes pubescens]
MAKTLAGLAGCSAFMAFCLDPASQQAWQARAGMCSGGIMALANQSDARRRAGDVHATTPRVVRHAGCRK